MSESVYQRIVDALAADDAKTLAAIAMELAAAAASAEALRAADVERRAKQADRTRRHRGKVQRDVTLPDVTQRDVTSPPPPRKERVVIGSPPVTPNGVSRTVPRPRAARPPAESWVAEGVGMWEAIVGTVSHGEFGAALKPMIQRHGWPAVRPDLDKWLRDRAASGKPCRPAWYAGEVTARLAPKPAIVDEHGVLTEYGERITRPDKVPA